MPYIDSFVIVRTTTSSLHVERSWERVEDLLPQLPAKYRYDLRRYVLPMESCYEFEIVNRETPPLRAEVWERIYQLYSFVQSRSYQLNTFPLLPVLVSKYEELV